MCGNALSREIQEIISDKEHMKKMGQNALKISTTNAEETIYKEIKN